MGCAFSTITGNEVHDIHFGESFNGWETAGIKFHGAIDVTISNNNIYRCGNFSGIWLDWMAQGAHVTGNFLHDNVGQFGDIFCEMQHGPILIANNLILSPGRSFSINSQGIAFAHNLICGPIQSMRGDGRATPFQQVHSTALAWIYNAGAGDSGDDRFYNNLFVAPCNLHAMDNTPLPSFAAGNVFTKGSTPSNFDIDALFEPEFDAGISLNKEADGWYLTIDESPLWREKHQRKLVTTQLLGSAKVSHEAFENADGTPIEISTDYFGRTRKANNPFPGPFEVCTGGSQAIKVWPKP